MTRAWFSAELETVATFWRVTRRDGVALGFTTHDRDLWFDGLLHRAAPGMVPSAIRRSAGFEPDSAEVQGALSHDAIAATDLAAGRFDGGAITVGLVDWESLDRHVVYRGTIGTVSHEAGGFTAQLQSRKAELQADRIPRTSPTCRATFCGPGCGLNAARFTHEAVLASQDADSGGLTFATDVPAVALAGGILRWLDGPCAGITMAIAAAEGDAVFIDMPIDEPLATGLRVLVREGCDRRLETCATRFDNAVNFQGEPFLPGNDLLARYPVPA